MIEPSVIRRKLRAAPRRWAQPRRGGAWPARPLRPPEAVSRSPRKRRRAAACSRAASPAGSAARIGQTAGALRLAGRASRRERAFALDKAARDIVGDRSDDPVDLLAFRDQHPPVEGILEEAIGPPVASHVDKGDHVEKEPRALALGQRQIEHVDARRRLPHDGFESAFEQREAARLDFAQIRNRLGAFGVFHSREPHRRRKVGLRRLRTLGSSSMASVPKLARSPAAIPTPAADSMAFRRN